jgi:hypothetical protein
VQSGEFLKHPAAFYTKVAKVAKKVFPEGFYMSKQRQRREREREREEFFETIPSGVLQNRPPFPPLVRIWRTSSKAG